MDNIEHACNDRPLQQASYIFDTFYMAWEKKHFFFILLTKCVRFAFRSKCFGVPDQWIV